MTGPGDARDGRDQTLRDPADAARRIDSLIDSGDLRTASDMVCGSTP